MTEPRVMTVGQLSRRSGVPVKALRDYTDWGLIYSLGRSAGNYRLYPPDALWCVQAIDELRGLGLTLTEIRQASAIADRDRDAVGPWLAGRLRAARARVERQLAALEQTRGRLDAFEAAHRAELTGQVPLWPDAPGESAA
jgi:DNA-binding transcriptional MerR regulator